MPRADFMKIKMDAKNSKVHKVYDENNNPAQELQTPDFEAKDVVGVGTVFMTRSSPGCAYYYYGGRWWKICS
ncbi:MAG: hypothetical protein ACE5FE_01840 [Acidiferrobacterales bacterium]